MVAIVEVVKVASSVVFVMKEICIPQYKEGLEFVGMRYAMNKTSFLSL